MVAHKRANISQRAKPYDCVYASIASWMCRQGSTNDDLAQTLDVTIDTIEYWRATEPDFRKACEVGEEIFDERVVASLYKRACGYDYEAEMVFQYEGRIIRARYLKHVPADVEAAKFWLINRLSERWSLHPEAKPDAETEGPLARLMKAFEKQNEEEEQRKQSCTNESKPPASTKDTTG